MIWFSKQQRIYTFLDPLHFFHTGASFIFFYHSIWGTIWLDIQNAFWFSYLCGGLGKAWNCCKLNILILILLPNPHSFRSMMQLIFKNQCFVIFRISENAIFLWQSQTNDLIHIVLIKIIILLFACWLTSLANVFVKKMKTCESSMKYWSVYVFSLLYWLIVCRNWVQTALHGTVLLNNSIAILVLYCVVIPQCKAYIPPPHVNHCEKNKTKKKKIFLGIT